MANTSLLNPVLAQALTASYDEVKQNTKTEERSLLFKEALDYTKGNLSQALDLVMASDNSLLNETNYYLNKVSSNNRSLSYGIAQDEMNRAAGILDTTTVAGGGNLLQTTVANFIEKRVEELGVIRGLVQSYQLSPGNYQIPTYGVFARSQATKPADDLPDLGASIEGGVNQITLNPYKFGNFVALRKEFLIKINPQNVAAIMELQADAHARGIDFDIINATGTSGLNGATNMTGILQNATSITGGSDDLDTLALAIGSVSDAQKGGLAAISVLINTATWAKFLKLRATNPAYLALIDSAKQTIHGIPTIISDVILSDSVNKNATAIVGYFKTFKLGTEGGIDTIIDNYTGAKSVTQNVIMYQYLDGRPAFNSSFAKFTVSNIIA